MRKLMLVCAVVGLVGCGSAGGSDPTAPGHVIKTYSLFSNQSETIEAGQVFEAPFSLPYDADFSYGVTNRSTTSPDHWDVSIVDASELTFFENGQSYRSASPLHQNVSTISDGGPLPAGDYAIAIICDNLIENCQFSLDATETY